MPEVPWCTAQESREEPSSAQADRGDESEYLKQVLANSNGFRLHHPDAEYTTDFKTNLSARKTSDIPRPMPEIIVRLKDIIYFRANSNEERPCARLPQTNLVEVIHPPGMGYNETYQWELALLLEGKAACVEPLPTWERGTIHEEVSKYLAFATRHSEEVK